MHLIVCTATYDSSKLDLYITIHHLYTVLVNNEEVSEGNRAGKQVGEII